MGPSQYDVHLMVLQALGSLKFPQPREGLDFLVQGTRTTNPFYRCERARRIPALTALKTIYPARKIKWTSCTRSVPTIREFGWLLSEDLEGHLGTELAKPWLYLLTTAISVLSSCCFSGQMG